MICDILYHCLQIDINDTDMETFLALLEYLYTDLAPNKDCDSMDLMVLADQYCLTRLISLCELNISQGIEQSCNNGIEKMNIDVIGILLTSQVSK